MAALSSSAMKWIALLVMSMTLVVIVSAKGGPIPAPNLPTQCNSIEKCCMPTPYVGAPIYQFQYESNLPMRTRLAAHTVSKDYIAKIEKAYSIIRALPDTDPRSLLNQMKLHCLYCDHALFYPGQKYALAVHNSWLFLPWHRMFLYFHERILAKVLNDDTFALSYWAWDNSLDVTPVPNAMPAQYAKSTSPLYDVNRNNCSYPPFLVDLDTIGGCTTKTPDFIRVQNDRLQYTQLVVGAPTTSLFYGLPYYFGDFGGAGPGTFEDQPHGTVHAWVGDPNAQPPRIPFDDMGHFGRAAIDPIFYAHHSNVDRLWNVWQTIPGGERTYPKDPAFLNSAFTFYDENARLVKINVSQVLDTDKLRYKFESQPAPWITNGVAKGRENTIAQCNPLSQSATLSLISATPKHKSSDIIGGAPVTFKVTRGTKRVKGTEVLELAGLRIPDISLQVHWKAFLFFPGATLASGPTCPEFVGTFNFLPVVGQPNVNPKRKWRVAIGPKLKQLGKDYVKQIVITIVQAGFPLQNVTFENAKIFYDLSPEETI